jgi:hypothetical protein
MAMACIGCVYYLMTVSHSDFIVALVSALAVAVIGQLFSV